MRVEKAKDVTLDSSMALSNRMDDVSHFVQTSRNFTEAFKEALDSQIQNIRDVLENDRSQRRLENAATNSLVDECFKAIVLESQSREDLDSRYTLDNARLSEQIEQLGCSIPSKHQDFEDLVKKMSQNFSRQVQEASKEAMNTRKLMESSEIELTSRVTKLERRLVSLESRVDDHSNKHKSLWCKISEISTTNAAPKQAEQSSILVREPSLKLDANTDRDDSVLCESELTAAEMDHGDKKMDPYAPRKESATLMPPLQKNHPATQPKSAVGAATSMSLTPRTPSLSTTTTSNTPVLSRLSRQMSAPARSRVSLVTLPSPRHTPAVSTPVRSTLHVQSSTPRPSHLAAGTTPPTAVSTTSREASSSDSSRKTLTPSSQFVYFSG